MRILKRLALIALIGFLCLVVLGLIAGGITYWLIEPRVPSVASLKDVQMQVPLRVLSADDKLIAEFGETRRIPVQIENVPAILKNAVLAAEDADFYHHSGIDITSTLRAAMEVALHRGEKVQGGSTITQQVARNFFLSPQKTYTRKITEMLTAFRIERELPKDQILQLYLNKMFLGHRSYGVAAAAQYYYGKTIDQLTLAQCAAIASSFQSPSVVNPLDHKQRLIARRNWVLGQMLSHRFINRAEYEQAIAAPNDAAPHEPPVQVDAPYLAEMVRQQALQKLGNQALTDGYVIHTTLDSRLQALANHALRSRLEDYDHRHGYRGPEAHIQLPDAAAPAALEQALSNYGDVSGLLPAIVTSVNAEDAKAYVQGGQAITLPVGDMKWAMGFARKANTGGKGAASVLTPGDIIRVREVRDADAIPAVTAKPDRNTTADMRHWELEQIPAAQAAMVSISPDDGAVKALVGGFNFQLSKFNRAVQTQRQPGSSFKPFIYSAAFSRGYTPASIINDAPIALPDPSKPGGLWTPQNDDNKFRGPMRLREALAQSVNLVAIRLLDAVGVRYVRDYVTRFGFPPDAIPANLSMALGTASVSPMAMARAYAVFANGGFLVNPYYIAEIDDRDGKAVYKADPLQACRTCEARLLDEGKTTAAPAQSSAAAGDPGALADTANAVDAGTQGPLLAPRVIDPRNDYLMASLMHSVIYGGGTGAAAAKQLGRNDLAGKTGSTNDHHDGWFCGFNSDLVTTVWVGFDDYRSLGRSEFGAKTALPIWMAFTGPALEGKPEAPLPMPPGIVTATIDATTGLPAPPGDTNTVTEMFKVEDLDRLRAEAKAQQNQAPAYDIF